MAYDLRLANTTRFVSSQFYRVGSNTHGKSKQLNNTILSSKDIYNSLVDSTYKAHTGAAIINNILMNTEWIHVNTSYKFNEASFICESARNEKIVRTQISRNYHECDIGSEYLSEVCYFASLRACKTNTRSKASNWYNFIFLTKMALANFFKIGSHKVPYLDSVNRTFIEYKCSGFLQQYGYAHHKEFSRPYVAEDILMTIWEPTIHIECSILTHWLCTKKTRLNKLECPHNSHQCLDQTCILFASWCDGKDDCNDGSDEYNCLHTFNKLDYGMHDLFKCTNDQFRCLNIKRCIYWMQVCDGYSDCEDQSDEELCHLSKDTLYINIEADQSSVNQTNGCPFGLSLCDMTSKDCYPNDKSCLYDRDIFGRNIYCQSSFYLQMCKEKSCLSSYKCYNSYCIPFHLVCDGILDCPNGEDENNCPSSGISCPGLFRCSHENICVHPNNVCDKSTQCLASNDDEKECELQSECPFQCNCEGQSMRCITNNISPIGEHKSNNIVNKRTLNMRAITLVNFYIGDTDAFFHAFKHMQVVTIENGKLLSNFGLYSNSVKIITLNRTKLKPNSTSLFKKLSETRTIFIEDIKIYILSAETFKDCYNLKTIIFKKCSINAIMSGAFYNLPEVTHLDLSSIDINLISDNSFLGMPKLQIMNISINNIERITQYIFLDLKALKVLDISHNNIIFIHPTALASGINLEIITSVSNHCCYIKAICHRNNSQLIESCIQCRVIIPSSDRKCSWLIPSDLLKLFTLSTSFLIIVINMLVFRTYHREVLNSHNILNQLLSLSYILSVTYPSVILLKHYVYKEQYPIMQQVWIKSMQCNLVGVSNIFFSTQSNCLLFIININALRLTRDALLKKPFNNTFIIVLYLLSIIFTIVCVFFWVVFLPSLYLFCDSSVDYYPYHVLSLALIDACIITSTFISVMLMSMFFKEVSFV